MVNIKAIEKLNTSINSSITNINRGGCAIFCFWFCVYCIRYNKRLPSIYRLKTKEDNCHYVLKYNDIYFDGQEWFNALYDGYVKVRRISFITLYKDLKVCSWNPEYDVSQNRLLRNLIKHNIKNM